MLAYTLKSYTGHQDDFEHGAGKKLTQMLLNGGHKEMAVFVSREFGGINLGPRHFLLIEKAARDALKELQSN